MRKELEIFLLGLVIWRLLVVLVSCVWFWEFTWRGRRSGRLGNGDGRCGCFFEVGR